MTAPREDFIRTECPICGGLLFRVDPNTAGEIEVKCRKCGNIKVIRLPRTPVAPQPKSA